MKCYAFIQVAKNNGISVAKTAFTRKAGELNPIHFMYSLDKGYHIEIDPEDAKQDKVQAKDNIEISKLKTLFSSVIPAMSGIRRSELEKLVEDKLGLKSETGNETTGTGKRRVTAAVKYGIITKGKDEHFRLAD